MIFYCIVKTVLLCILYEHNKKIQKVEIKTLYFEGIRKRIYSW